MTIDQAIPNPPISQRDFFTLKIIRGLQQVQKENPYGSKAHKFAWHKICEIARAYGVGEHFNEADY